VESLLPIIIYLHSWLHLQDAGIKTQVSPEASIPRNNNTPLLYAIAPTLVVVNALLVLYLLATFGHFSFIFDNTMPIAALTVMTAIAAVAGRRVSLINPPSNIAPLERFVAKHLDPAFGAIKLTNEKRRVLVVHGLVCVLLFALDGNILSFFCTAAATVRHWWPTKNVRLAFRRLPRV
jgi:hypothetical protein